MGGRLDRTTTNCCKGIAAIIIMLHHISFRLSNLPVYVKPIWYIAFPIVGFFFFMSGYGLTCGLLQKRNYLQGFLSKRLLNIIAPYVIVAIVWIGLEIIGGGQTPTRAIAEVFTIRYIQPLWFISKTPLEKYEGEEVLSKFLPELICTDPKTGTASDLLMSAWSCLYRRQLLAECNFHFVSERKYISERYEV